MKYGLIYKVPFATLENVPCVVEIEKEGYSGKVTELIPASSPFTVEIGDEEFLYTPTRFSTAVIRIVGSDYLQSLFSTAYQEYRVTFKKSNAVVWCGFIKPELYTQDYSSTIFELELECISGMSTLEYIDYKQGGDNRKFVSLWDLLKTCISSANSQYTSIYVPHIYAQNDEDYTAGINVLEKMTVSEQDFFDEEDKPMKLKEVLEEVCKFLNWTCVDWKGELYFVDNDHVGEFYEYRPDTFVMMGVSTPKFHNVQRIGFAGAGHSLDILPGYNKVAVKCSNYPVGELIPDEDFDNLDIAVIPPDVNRDNKISHKIVYLPNRWDLQQYIKNGSDNDGRAPEYVSPDWVVKNKEKANNLLGAMPIRFSTYELVDGVPNKTSYNYEDGIQVRWTIFNTNYTAISMDLKPVIRIKGVPATYADGALSVSGQLKRCLDSAMALVGTPEWPFPPRLKCLLRIGEYWYCQEDGHSLTPSKQPIWKKNPSDKDSKIFNIEFNNTSSEWYSIKDTKTLDMPYEGLSGCVIPIGQEKTGDLEFIIYGSSTVATALTGEQEYGMFLKGLSLSFQKSDLVRKTENNSDRIYENVVNENFINELDEIEFKISSYNNDGACYSKVMLGENYLTDNLYSALEGKMVRPEEQLIRRIIKRYSAPRIKLTQVIKATPDLTPLSRLYDNFMVNKIFINAGGTIDYKMNQFECIMIEV